MKKIVVACLLSATLGLPAAMIGCGGEVQPPPEDLEKQNEDMQDAMRKAYEKTGNQPKVP